MRNFVGEPAEGDELHPAADIGNELTKEEATCVSLFKRWDARKKTIEPFETSDGVERGELVNEKFFDRLENKYFFLHNSNCRL